MLLTFPDGRLDTRLARWVMTGAGVAVVPLPIASLLLGGPGDVRSVLQVTSLPVAADLIIRFQIGLGALLAALTVAVIIRRWRRASRPLRLAAAPVFWAGAAGFAVVMLSFVEEELGRPFGDSGAVLRDLVMAAIPMAFLLGLLRARLAHSPVADLVVELGATTAPGELRKALARALRDPSLTLAYRLSDSERYVDVDGHPVKLAGPDEDRSVTFAKRDGGPLPRSCMILPSATILSWSNPFVPRRHWHWEMSGCKQT